MEKERFRLYEKTKLPLQILISPLPLLFVFNTLPYIVLFTIVYVGLFLAKEWSTKARIFLTLRRVNAMKAGTVIYYNGFLTDVKVRNGIFYFEHDNDYFVIKTIKSEKEKTEFCIHLENIECIERLKIEDVFVKGISRGAISTIRDLEIKNTFNYRPPTFLRLFYQHATAPFFCLQIFCSLLWCLDEYPYHALFSMIMQVLFEAGIVFTRLKNLQEFGQLDMKKFTLEVSDKDPRSQEKARKDKNGAEEDINTVIANLKDSIEERSFVPKKTTEIFPGDVLLITKPVQLPCDLIMLKGECAVNESMLTGESIPLTKDAFTDKLTKRNLLYGGTEIIQLKDKIYCYVYRTGFYTEQGNLIKTMMKDTSVTIENKETYLFILVLLFFAMIASSVVIYYNTKSYYKLMLEVIIILTNVVPPEMPMEMTLAVNSALQNLLRKSIFCLESFRIPIGGKIDVCCFDKTGTLTESDMEVVKIIKYNKNKPTAKDCEAQDFEKHYDVVTKENLNEFDMSDVNACISNCHSLLTLPNLTGDPMEKSLFQFLNLKLENEVTSDGKHKYVPVKRFAFTSELRRMTSVFTKQGKTYASMKGAPETIKCFLSHIPDDYDQLYKHFSAQGYRIIALALKSHKKNFTREAVERDMEFVGFVLYECKIKPRSYSVIKDLKACNCEVVMITGDNLLTAMCVAKKVGIIDEADKRTDNTKKQTVQNNFEEQGVEGGEIDNVLNSEAFSKYKVFARADPLHKEKIIKKYQSMNKIVLMCGDGTNDVGALKTSDVGVALVKPSVKREKRSGLEDDKVRLGDASVAAAFTAKTGCISSVLEIIRQGRATLVTTIQMYKILALNSLVSAFSLSFLDILGIRYGDVQMTIAGVIIAFAFAFLTRSKVLKEISKQRPVENIFNKYIVFSVFLQSLIHIASFVLVIKNVNNVVYEKEGFGMMSEMFDTKWENYGIKLRDDSVQKDLGNNKTEDSSSKFYPSTLNSTIFILAISQQLNTFIINYIGRPFRESLQENISLLISLSSCSAVIVSLVFEVHTGFSRLMEIVPLPNKTFLFCVLAFDFILCYVIEKICFRLFIMKQ